MTGGGFVKKICIKKALSCVSSDSTVSRYVVAVPRGLRDFSLYETQGRRRDIYVCRFMYREEGRARRRDGLEVVLSVGSGSRDYSNSGIQKIDGEKEVEKDEEIASRKEILR